MAKTKAIEILVPIFLISIFSFFINIIAGIILFFAVLPTAVFCVWYYILVRAYLFGALCGEGDYLVLVAGEGGKLKDIIANKRGEALDADYNRIPDPKGVLKRADIQGAYFFNSLFASVKTEVIHWKKAITHADGTVTVEEREEFVIGRGMVDYPHAIPVDKAETSDKGKVNFIITVVLYLKNLYKAEENTKTHWIVLAEQHLEKAFNAWAKEVTLDELFSKGFSEISELLEKYIEDHGVKKSLLDLYGIEIRNILFRSLEESDKELASANRRKLLATLEYEASEIEGKTSAVLNSADIGGTAERMVATDLGLTVEELAEKKRNNPAFAEAILSRTEKYMAVAQRTLANKNNNYFELNINSGNSEGQDGMAGRMFEAAFAANLATRSGNKSGGQTTTSATKGKNSFLKKRGNNPDDDYGEDNNDDEPLSVQDVIDGKRPR
ncbi:MAG: hypothetical protein WC520_03625 [Candidatus Paceibacterota bacterium]